MLLHIENSRFRTAAAALFLAAAVLFVYGQTGGHDFIIYDDPEYITENPFVRQGLTAAGAVWAFSAFHAGNWHPLTWLSHMLDVELFGMAPAGHHLTNAVLHTINSIMLFHLLARLTGAFWKSIVVAALFALHPLHVESVAWAAERKDVLSAFFWMLTLQLYVRYAKRPGGLNYTATISAYALGLMAKPMLVTLPLIMLLLDHWPLKRLEQGAGFWRLIKEKIPFAALAVASCTVTMYAQTEARSPLHASTVLPAIYNAVLTCLRYLGKTLLPQNMAVFYPFRSELSGWQVSGAALLLFVISAIAVRQRHARPYLPVGWFWYIITLIPVLGIVQAGIQAMADRYTYIPLVGIFMLAAWGAEDITGRLKRQRMILTALTCAVLAAYTMTARHQVSYWRSSDTLFTHALAATRNNYVAHVCLGYALELQEKFDEAVVQYETALTVQPYFKQAYVKLGGLYRKTGRQAEAAELFETALSIYPNSPDLHYQLGTTYYTLGSLDKAIEHYNRELVVNPSFVDCHNNLGIALADSGRLDEAVSHFTRALALKPDYFQAQKNLEHVLTVKNARKAYK